MAAPDDRVQEIVQATDAIFEAGREQGQREVQERFYGKSAAVLTAQLFAASMTAAAQGLRQHNADASAFFAQKAKELQDFTIPARVANVEPPDGATGVVPENAVSVQFAAQIDPSTLTGGFTLTPASGGSVLQSVTEYDENTRTATLHPRNPLSPGVEYRARVLGTVRASGGQLMGDDFTWAFTVAPEA